MSVPKCKKKKGGSNVILNKAEKRFQRMVDEMELQATANASQYAQMMLYYALERRYGFGVKRIMEVSKEIEVITQEMLANKYDLEWIENHFKEKGITIQP